MFKLRIGQEAKIGITFDASHEVNKHSHVVEILQIVNFPPPFLKFENYGGGGSPSP